MLRGAGDEVCDDRIESDASARDQDASLTGRAEIGGDAACTHRLSQRECGVFLPERAIGSDREQPLAAAASTAGSREGLSWQAHVDELDAAVARSVCKSRNGFERPVHAAHYVETRGNRVVQDGLPCARDLAAYRCDADDERSDTRARCRVWRHIG
jgi:hypothetical protein